MKGYPVGDLSLPDISPNQFSGRSDTQTNKSESLAAIAAAGSLKQAIRNGDITYDTLSRYLTDGNYREKLGEVQEVIAAKLASKAINKALDDLDKDQARMLEFTLPALDQRFDSGIRREKAKATGVLGSMLFKQLLDRTVEAPPNSGSSSIPIDAISSDSSTMTDKETYQSIQDLTGTHDTSDNT